GFTAGMGVGVAAGVSVGFTAGLGVGVAAALGVGVAAGLRAGFTAGGRLWARSGGSRAGSALRCTRLVRLRFGVSAPGELRAALMCSSWRGGGQRSAEGEQ